MQQPSYSFRQGTLQEWRSRDRSTILNWVIIAVMLVLLFFGVIAAGIAASQVWELQQGAHQLEFGASLQQPGPQEWAQILFVAVFVFLPFTMPIVGLLLFWGIANFALRQPENQQVWLACHQHKIIGCALLVQKQNYTILAGVQIDLGYRRQKIGSHLLWHSLKQVQRPVYLICASHLQSFYRQLGFVPIPKRDRPKELRRSSLQGMGLFQESIQPDPYVSNTLPASNLSVCLLSDWRTRWKIYRLFWRRKRFQQSRLRLLSVVGFLVVAPLCLSFAFFWGLQSLTEFAGWHDSSESLSGIKLPAVAIIFWLVWQLISLRQIFSRWQEWVLYENDRPIAYVHVAVRSQCSILYHLQIEPQYSQQEIAVALLKYLSRKVPFPLYFSCPQRDRPFYAKLGFTLAEQNGTPWEMKMLQFGYDVPLKLAIFLSQDR